MARMYPDKPKVINAGSLEDVMFDSLSRLPDDYCIFHSYKIVEGNRGVLYESETDFVIFHRKKGILCIEAKAGKIKCVNGTWYYGSGVPMEHDGPFDQAAGNKWKLFRYIKSSIQAPLLKKCKLLHAVWFPSITELDMHKIVYPSEGDRGITLTSEAVFDPCPYIEKIYHLENQNHTETNLSEVEAQRLLDNIFCPSFELVPHVSLDLDLKNSTFIRLLKEQASLLSYLEDQNNAVINGVAGTGKTLIAVEKARRHSLSGDSVLFLCYNAPLKNYLNENCSYENVYYYTIDGLACKMCRTNEADYAKLKKVLEEKYYDASFEYQHVIIDEGQDFGQDKIEETDIVSLLELIVLDNSHPGGSFYVFYDKLQLVQGRKIPEYIQNADCKLTLYKNCRNTENIAETSMRPLGKVKPKLFEGSIKGVSPKMWFCQEQEVLFELVDKAIVELKRDGYTNIVILTCKTIEKSVLSSCCLNDLYRGKITFTTCRKFKGLEADAVILVDVDADAFSLENVKLFYVGASRARFRLDIIANLKEDECREVLTKMGKVSFPKKPFKELATALNAVYICD